MCESLCFVKTVRNSALARRPPAINAFGSRLALSMKQYRHTLQSRGIVQSMSRKGNCHDNSVMENFFGIMKSEFLYPKEFKSIDHFKEELEKYINYYNTKRIKAKLKLSPIQYRTQFTQAA